MVIKKAGYEILDCNGLELDGTAIIKKIERIARICYKSEGFITEDDSSARRILHTLIDNGHHSVLEHFIVSVQFSVDRGVTHEMVRHRLASFTQSSTRYYNYSLPKFENQIPVIDLGPGLKEENPEITAEQFDKIMEIWMRACQNAEDSYMEMIEAGATPQMARSVLPQSCQADIVISANLREWRHILSLRAAQTTGKAHPQMLEVMKPLLEDFHNQIPVIFDDVYEAMIAKDAK